MSFARDVMLKPAPLAWGGVSAAIGCASFFGIDNNVAIELRSLGAASLFLLLALVGMTTASFDLYKRAKSPVAVRTILEGTHFYQGRLIVILDKSNWIEPGQLLALVAGSDGVQLPLCLLTVETTTTDGFPQCVVAISLTTERLDKYLADRSRWRSLSALPDIKARYLEATPNG